MSEPFLGEISMFGFNFAPRGWAQCDGQILPINQNQSLYSLLGTTYGGDGRTSFGLPDLRGRVPIHPGTGTGLPPVTWGQKAGAETVALTPDQIPSHVHMQGSGDGATAKTPTANVTASKPRVGPRVYTPPANRTPLASDELAGGGQAHNNMQPYLVVNFCIALTGIFPSRN